MQILKIIHEMTFDRVLIHGQFKPISFSHIIDRIKTFDNFTTLRHNKYA